MQPKYGPESAMISHGQNYIDFITIFVKMEPTEKVGSRVWFYFEEVLTIDTACCPWTLTQMVMPFVQIVERGWNVAQGLQTLKNAIGQVTQATEMGRADGFACVAMHLG